MSPKSAGELHALLLSSRATLDDAIAKLADYKRTSARIQNLIPRDEYERLAGIALACRKANAPAAA
jgi:hypothetical protein